MQHDRVFGLDVFRAVAILLVVLVHGGFMLNNTALDGFPWFRMIDGVDLFFVLSGFLIGGILLKEINKPQRFGLKSLAIFWKRRWFRTLPAYYLVLLLNYIFVHQHIVHEDITQANWKFLVFAQNLYQPFHGFFWESWSLSIEEWFYLTAPLLLVVLLRLMKPNYAFLWVTLSMIVFSTVYRACNTSTNIDLFWFDSIYRKLVVMRLDSIGYGLLSAWMFYYAAGTWKKLRYAFFALGVVLMAFVINYKSPVNGFYMQVLVFTLTPVSAMLLLPLMSSISHASGMVARTITHISKISYSMYLINLGLVACFIRDNHPPQGGMDGIAKYCLYWGIVIIASTVLYEFFEKPVMNLRDRI
jgi:peptidoglycan/LPS O-acetylase OafA/YrhL